MTKRTNNESLDSSSAARRASEPTTARRQPQPRKRSKSTRANSTANESAQQASNTVMSSLRTRREERRRVRTKEKANKLFARQFSTESPSTRESEGQGTPRAALYKGTMGASQRRSARMQRSSSAEGSSVKVNPLGWLSTLPITEHTLKAATAVICVLLVGVFLYAPAQQYYQAQREHDRLAAEYSVIEERNKALDEQNDIYASDAGMEDAVRAKYGYVKEGEHTAIVTGLSEHATDSSRDNEQLEPAILSSSVKAPEEWYTPFLDAFFGVK